MVGRCKFISGFGSELHDHIHVLFYVRHKEDQVRFLRLFAGEMGRKYKRIKQSYGLSAANSIWAARPFTRLVAWGRKSIEGLKRYIRQNRDEALGFIAYKPRRHRLAAFLLEWEQRLSSA